MYQIHMKLADNATVIYISKYSGSLWTVGLRFVSEVRAKAHVYRAPVYMLDGKSLEGHWWSGDYDLARHFSRNKPYAIDSLAFYPGKGWFGP